MVRSWAFTLPNSAVSYNLWDLIDATITDKTFSNSPYVPKIVDELQCSMSALGPNSAGNLGNNISMQSPAGQEMRNMLPGDIPVVLQGHVDLTQIKFQGSAGNVTVGIIITTR